MSQRWRPAEERRNDFDDVALPFTDIQARWEAARCLGCHDAPCRRGCDANVDVRGFIELIRFGDVRGAAELIRRANVLGASCARVCDGDEQCQRRCVRAQLDRPVDIPSLQWYALNRERALGPRPLPVGPDRGRSVAIVGGGPAGLAAAAELRRMGHRVTLFEADEELGGLLVHGIPRYRLPRNFVLDEIEAIVQTGLEIHLGHRVEGIDELLKAFDAVIVAIGAGQSSPLNVDGEDLDGVYTASEILNGSKTDVGVRPMVIGGGTAAMDAATMALRLSGPSGRVAVLYRRAEQQMPARTLERRLAAEEGVILRPLTVAERILGDRDRRVAAVRCRAVDLGPPDSSGRPGPVELSGGTFDLQATSVISAAGEEFDPIILEQFGLTEAEPRGDEAGRTEVEKLYVAGDIVGGPRTVAWSVASGVRAARSVDYDLKSGTEPDRVFPVLGPDINLEVELFGKTVPNPFVISASPSTDDIEMARAGLQAGWGGVVIRTTSVEELEVSPRFPTMAPVSDGPRMLASMGNIDLISERHIESSVEMVKTLREEFPDRYVAASIVGENRAQWQKLARELTSAGVDAIECNFSAPFGTLGTRPEKMVGQDPSLVKLVTKWVVDASNDTPVVVKVTPQVTDITEITKAVAEAGAQGITAANSVPGIPGLDIDNGAPQPSVGGASCVSGMTGPAILPFSLSAIAGVAKTANLTVFGSGGAESWRDAVTMMLLGANAVQFCTAIMHHGFGLIDALKTGLAHHLERQGLESVDGLIGRALENVKRHEELKQPGPVRARINEETCINCGRCHTACRDGGYRAITWNDETREPAVLLERCVGCGLCAGLCPSDAISFLTLK